jgi:hypothetical protein
MRQIFYQGNVRLNDIERELLVLQISASTAISLFVQNKQAPLQKITFGFACDPHKISHFSGLPLIPTSVCLRKTT